MRPPIVPKIPDYLSYASHCASEEGLIDAENRITARGIFYTLVSNLETPPEELKIAPIGHTHEITFSNYGDADNFFAIVGGEEEIDAMAIERHYISYQIYLDGEAKIRDALLSFLTLNFHSKGAQVKNGKIFTIDRGMWIEADPKMLKILNDYSMRMLEEGETNEIEDIVREDIKAALITFADSPSLEELARIADEAAGRPAPSMQRRSSIRTSNPLLPGKPASGLIK